MRCNVCGRYSNPFCFDKLSDESIDLKIDICENCEREIISRYKGNFPNMEQDIIDEYRDLILNAEDLSSEMLIRHFFEYSENLYNTYENIDVDNIEESPTKYTITYKYKGRNLCEIDPRRDSFYMRWRTIDGNWETEPHVKEFDEAQEIVDTIIRKFYEHLKKIR